MTTPENPGHKMVSTLGVWFVIPGWVAHSIAYKKLDSIANATVTGNKMVFDLANAEQFQRIQLLKLSTMRITVILV